MRRTVSVGLGFVSAAALLSLSLAACDDLTPIVKVTGNADGGEGGTTAPDSLMPINDPNVIPGGITMAFGGKCQSWANKDPQTGKVVTLSYTIPLITITTIPSTAPEDERILVDIPKEVVEQTTMHSLVYNYYPHGHKPLGVYDTPHWEFHMGAVTHEEFAQVDCSDKTTPVNEIMPDNWIYVPPPDNCVIGVGIHALNTQSPEFNKERFTLSEGMVFYHGLFYSVEPKITKTLITARTDYTIPITHIKKWPPGTTVPERVTLKYNKEFDTYVATVNFKILVDGS
jgi:hypothetical protein